MRSGREVITDISNTYAELSPENLTCDGELSPAKVQQKRARLERKLKALFKEAGEKHITEMEAYNRIKSWSQPRSEW